MPRPRSGPGAAETRGTRRIRNPSKVLLLLCREDLNLRLAGKGRHDIAGKTVDLLARPAEVYNDVFDAALLQFFELSHDLVGGAEKGAFGALVPRFLLVVQHVAGSGLAVRPTRQPVDPHVALVAPLERRRFVRIVLGDVDGAGDAHLHRVKGAAERLDLAAKLRDLLEGLVGQRVLPQQHVVAAPHDLTDRILAARPHPERRVRLLRGRRFDDDVVELPIFAAMGERLLRGKGLGDDLDRFFEPRVGFLQRYAEPGEFVVAVTLADPEIEPAAGQEIERRRLLGQQHWVVPGQDQHRCAEAQMPRAGAEPGQQIEARGDLAEAGEVMLDEKGAVITERFGLDIVIDELAEALAAVGVGAAAPRLRTAEQSKSHHHSPDSLAPVLLAISVTARIRASRAGRLRRGWRVSPTRLPDRPPPGRPRCR